MLLDLLAGVFNVLTGTVSRTTTHRSEDQRHRRKQQQNYSFNHNRSVFCFSTNGQFLLFHSGSNGRSDSVKEPWGLTRKQEVFVPYLNPRASLPLFAVQGLGHAWLDPVSGRIGRVGGGNFRLGFLQKSFEDAQVTIEH